MRAWWRKARPGSPAVTVEERLRRKYASFRNLLSLNNECLELLAGMQEDLRDVPPRRDIFESRISAIYERAESITGALGQLNGGRYNTLPSIIEAQRRDVESYISACRELATPRLSAWLTEIDSNSTDAGGKAAALGEVRNRLGLPVPDGYVLTTESYWQFCGVPLWTSIRDAMRDIDLNDLEALQAISARLREMVIACQVPRAVEIAITERARTLAGGAALAVRSSATGEGGERTFAGQFMSLINVPPEQAVDAYKRVVAERFSERALFYRLSTGLTEVESPMAVLFLPVIQARASGIMYTRDPKDPKRDSLWITSTRGLGMEIASGRMPADLFVVSRRHPHKLLDCAITRKEHEIIAAPGGGLGRRPLAGDAEAPSLSPDELSTLAAWGVRMEEHFRAP
ncbi:MAG: PEP/pyruvate-binding domain-containing protein, partial [Acidobacteria bacterium]|nr:PEP/pyruvate-binding domain-containing protein [Acidobacteriota bacterium]